MMKYLGYVSLIVSILMIIIMIFGRNPIINNTQLIRQCVLTNIKLVRYLISEARKIMNKAKLNIVMKESLS